MLMATKLDAVMTYLKGFILTKSHTPLVMWSCEITWHLFISTITVPMVSKLGRMISYLEGFLVIKSIESSITWCCKIKWKTKIIISSLTQCLWSPNLAGWWISLRGSNLLSHMALESRVPLRLCDKIKTSNLHYQNFYAYQIFQGGNLPWGTPTHNVKWYLIT